MEGMCIDRSVSARGPSMPVMCGFCGTWMSVVMWMPAVRGYLCLVDAYGLWLPVVHDVHDTWMSGICRCPW